MEAEVSRINAITVTNDTTATTTTSISTTTTATPATERSVLRTSSSFISRIIGGCGRHMTSNLSRPVVPHLSPTGYMTAMRKSRQETNPRGISISSSVSSLENAMMSESISKLTFLATYSVRKEMVLYPTLWIGTHLGTTMAMKFNIPSQRSSEPVVASRCRTMFRMSGEMKEIALLSATGTPLPTPSDKWESCSRDLPASTPAQHVQTGACHFDFKTTQEELLSVASKSNNNNNNPNSPTIQDQHLVVLCSEKQVWVVGLPSQTLLYSSCLNGEVLLSSVLHYNSTNHYPLLCCSLKGGALACYSLPSLHPLYDFGNCHPPSEDILAESTFRFAQRAMGIYFYSPCEIQKITLSKEISVNRGNIYTKYRSPEAPKKGFLQTFFKSLDNHLDRDALFGEEASGKASATVSTYTGNARLSKTQQQASMASSDIGRARLAAMERGEKLEQLDLKTQQMTDEAKNLRNNARLLAKKYENKSQWWPF